MTTPPKAIEFRRDTLTRTILALAAPAVLENLLVTAVFLVDAIFVGHLHDDAAMAAVGLGGTIAFIANGLFEALAVSAVALVARAWGERDWEQAERVAAQALILSFLIAGLFMAVLMPLTDEFFWLLVKRDDPLSPLVVQQGSLYVRILLSTSLLSFPMMVANGAMRGAGDTRTPMWITLVMNVWNAGTAYLLIFGYRAIPGLGLAGAGYATASARALGGLIALVILFSGRTRLRVRPAALLHWDLRLIGRIFRVALPNLGETVASRVGYILFTKMLADLGTVVLAAHQIAIRVESFSFMPGFGLSVAAATLAGQALGAKNEEMAELSIRRTLLMALVLMGAIGVAFALFGPQIVTIFGGTPAVLAPAGMAVRIAAVEQPTMGVQFVVAGGLRGAGDTRTPMWVTLAGTVFLRVAVVYLFVVVFKWGLAGVWWGTAVDWAGRATFLWLLFRRGRWKRVRV